MKLKKLIVNADDFGMTEANTLATILAHEDGIVSSTTLMVNMPFAGSAVKLAQNHPTLGVGIHLVLTIGRPLIDGAKSFTDENGYFRRPASYDDGHPHADLDELYIEWKAQIDKFIEIMGRKPTHMDSHHHVHSQPDHLDVTMRLSKEYQLPVRFSDDQYPETYPYRRAPMVRGFYGDQVNLDYFTTNQFGLWDHEIAEVMCHPAFLDERLLNISSYTIPRTKELAILRNDNLKTWIKANGIELITFEQLNQAD